MLGLVGQGRALNPATQYTVTVGSHALGHFRQPTMMRLRTILFLSIFFPSLTFSQTDIEREYQTSLEALEMLKQMDIEGFKHLIDETVLKGINDQTLKTYAQQASDILNKHELPKKEFLMLGISATAYNGKPINVLSLGFPFPPPGKPGAIADQYIMMIFSKDISEDKIVGFKIRDLTGPARKIEEKARKTPHLSHFDFKTENVTWFRIWYDRGPVKNNFGGQSGVYALSGNLAKLKEAEIEKLISEIFNLLNSAKIDSTDYKYGLRKTVGNPEDIYLRFTFKNYDYTEFNEFDILSIITPEDGVDELSDGYIVIKHSQVYRYFLKVSDNQELWEKLKTLAHIDHGDLLEKNP